MIRRARPHGAWAVRGGGVITIDSVGDALQRVEAQIGRVIIGQQRVVEQALCALLADGHILIEGVPGIAKTLLVRVIAQTLGLQFRRVQFTPDLMPSDLIGTTIFDAPVGRVPRALRTDFRQHRAGRRSEPHPTENAIRAVGGDGGAQGHHRRRLARAAAPLYGVRHAEPHRVRGNLPAARSAVRPIPAQGSDGLPR
jgi:hypothetical protein